MKKLSLFILTIAISTSAMAQVRYQPLKDKVPATKKTTGPTLQDAWNKIYLGFYKVIGMYPLSFCINKEYMFTGMDDVATVVYEGVEIPKIEQKNVDNDDCIVMAKKFVLVETKRIHTLIYAEGGPTITDNVPSTPNSSAPRGEAAKDQSEGKKDQNATMVDEAKKAAARAADTSNGIGLYSAEINQALVDFYELTTRIAAGPLDGGTYPERAEFFKQLRAKLKLKPLYVETCKNYLNAGDCVQLPKKPSNKS